MWRETEKGGERWISYRCGRKEALVSPEIYGLNDGVPFLCKECGKTPNPSVDSHCRRDVSNRHAAVCFRVMQCDFCVLLFLLRLPLHVADTLCHLTPAPPPQTKLYFYECLQYLLEAKKAQQSLESTYKQLDSVSLEEEEVKLMYSIQIWSQ